TGSVSGFGVATVAIAATAVNLWADDASGITTELRDVWGHSSGNVFAVGTGGVVRYFNGSTWATSTTSVAADLSGVWGTGPSDVFAGAGSGTPRVIRRGPGGPVEVA